MQTLDYPTFPRESPTETALDIDAEMGTELHREPTELKIPQLRLQPGMGWLRANIGRWVLSVTAATAPFGYIDPRQELRQSGASSMMWSPRERRGRPISLAQAREHAFRILERTEQRLRQERATESRFLLRLWEDEGDTAV